VKRKAEEDWGMLPTLAVQHTEAKVDGWEGPGGGQFSFARVTTPSAAAPENR